MSKVGENIRKKREQLGMSQENLAEATGISRQAVSYIENGKRAIKADELIKMSEIFSSSVDRLLGLIPEPEVHIDKSKGKSIREKKIRINVPQNRVSKFKEVLLYLLQEIGMRTNVGETVIYKLLYFIDFDFYEKYEEQLIGASYQKNKWGPTPIEFREVIKSMIDNNEIRKITIDDYYGYKQKKYIPKRKPDLSELSAREIELINDVISRLGHKSARQLSDYSHNDIPYRTTENGAVIEYEAVFYRTPEYSVRDYDEEEEVQ